MKNPNLAKFLLDALPKDEFKTRFKAKLKAASDDNYWQIMSEMRAIYIFNNLLKIPVIGIDVLTDKGKNVDFVIEYGDERTYIEVKDFIPTNEVLAKKSGSIGSEEEKICRALRRSIDKFSKRSCNVVVVADENTKRLPLFMNLLTINLLADLGKILRTCLERDDYKKISAIMVLGGMYYKQQYDYKTWYNDGSSKKLPKRVRKVLDKHKSNIK